MYTKRYPLIWDSTFIEIMEKCAIVSGIYLLKFVHAGLCRVCLLSPPAALSVCTGLSRSVRMPPLGSTLWPKVSRVSRMLLVDGGLPRQPFCVSSSSSVTVPLFFPDPSMSPCYPDNFLFLAQSPDLLGEFLLG